MRNGFRQPILLDLVDVGSRPSFRKAHLDWNHYTDASAPRNEVFEFDAISKTHCSKQ